MAIPTSEAPISTGNSPSSIAVATVILIGVACRLLSANTYDNYDMESWWIASEAMRAGESIYSATHRYNYGPIWAYIIEALRYISSLSGADTMSRLHLFIAAFLTLADIGLAFLLYRYVSYQVAFLFFLNPISSVVTGYHIQFDNVAILLALTSWVVLSKGSSSTSTIVAGVLFGASLSMKHVFLLFVAWLPFITTTRSAMTRLTFGSIGLTFFFASFLPWLAEPAAWQGIRANVFGYTSTEGHTLTSLMAPFTLGIAPRTIFMVLITLTGVALMRKRSLHAVAPLLYLVALPALSSGMARNYLAIPLITVFVSLRTNSARAYLIIATCALITTHAGLGTYEVMLALLSSKVISYELAQIALLVLLVEIFRKPDSISPCARNAT